MPQIYQRQRLFYSHVISFIIVSFICSAFSESYYSGDLKLLITLRDSLVERRNLIPSWFDTKVSPCSWSGIRCSADSKVHEVDLSTLLLQLPFPSPLGEFEELKRLNLKYCSLTGHIPMTLWNLANLEVLDLSWNSLDGPIPSEIGRLTMLKSLEIGNTNLHGEIPRTIGNLTNLVNFGASNSGLSGAIPGELGNCKKLKMLVLSFNSLSGPLPEGLMGLESIHTLVLESNHLSGAIPNWISKWKGVNSLKLSENMFNGSLPQVNLPYLTMFDASSNLLSGEIPKEICDAYSLTTLSLSNNKLSGSINSTFQRCLALRNLKLVGNNLLGEIPGYLGELPLVTVELSSNKFSGKLPDELWNSPSIMEILLGNNLLVGQIPSAISRSVNLHRLQLDNNLLEGAIPRTIGYLKNVTSLSLHGNKLTGEIPLELFNCMNLVSLDLGANKLTGPIPKSVSRLKLLDNLVLSQNLLYGPIPDEICSGFQEGPMPDSEFSQHYGMLDLSYNEFVGPIPRTIKQCTILSQLLLQGNKLNGSIPQEISGLTNLIVLDLSFNYLTGPALPRFFVSKHLQGLFLSQNQLNGSIPDELGSMMPSLIKLKLFRNFLTGSLPPSIFNMTSLSYVDISLNPLSGSISFAPSNLGISSLLHLNASNNLLSSTLSDSLSNLTTLFVLDLHNNSFTGSLPSSLSTLSSLEYLDVSDNDFQFIPCSICTMPNLAFLNFSGNKLNGYESCAAFGMCLSNESSIVQAHSSPPVLNKTSVLGITLGAIFSLVILFTCLGIYIHATPNDSSTSEDVLNDSPTPEDVLLNTSNEPPSINIAIFEPSLLQFSLADILIATENFSESRIVGDGGFATIYKGCLSDGKTGAVKRLKGGHSQGDRDFSAEMETLGKVRHENLVQLHGYCVSGDDKFLIYEYMEKGNLEKWLRDSADVVEPLDWPTRFKICLGSARGLSFLHHSFAPHIIHRDIKSANILLDNNFEPKVADFGLARLISAYESHVSTTISGTIGYIPPEYAQQMATRKGDVYSFGVVMLELLTGQAPLGQPDSEGGNLVGWVRWMVEMEKVDGVFDHRVVLCNKSRDQMKHVLGIARQCTFDEPWRRPTMWEVKEMLNEIKINFEMPADCSS